MSTPRATDNQAANLAVGTGTANYPGFSTGSGLRPASILVMSGLLAMLLLVWLSFGPTIAQQQPQTVGTPDAVVIAS